jgi:hypothetical protein
MAETQYTTNSAQLIALSVPAQLPAASGLDLCAELIVRMPCERLLEYQGTRAAIEAEGLIPSETVWPVGFSDLHWQDGDYNFWIRRQRPDGVKGPRKLFLEIDWWMLRINPVNFITPDQWVIERKAKELREATYRATAKGRADMQARFDRSWDARHDSRFMAFLSRIPGINGKKRVAA